MRAFANYLGPFIKQHFRRWPEVYEDYAYRGLTLTDIISSLTHDKDSELLEAISAYLTTRDGEPEGFFEAGLTYQKRNIPVARSMEPWINASSAIKYRQRFFSKDVLALFERLFKNVEALTAEDPNGRAPDQPVCSTLPAGTVVFRARKLSADAESVKEFVLNPFEELGAAPARRAAAGRMSAKGVRAFYGAREPETCFAELRPSIGDRIGIGKFRALRDLRILDFSLLSTAMPAKDNLLDPQRDERFMIDTLLEELSAQIALPVLPDQEEDYLITQAMAEYLAYVRNPAFDGVIFQSVQQSGGFNLVLFEASADGIQQGFPLEWVGDAPVFWEARAVTYAWKEIGYGTHEGHYHLPPRINSAKWHRWTLEQEDED